MVKTTGVSKDNMHRLETTAVTQHENAYIAQAGEQIKLTTPDCCQALPPCHSVGNESVSWYTVSAVRTLVVAFDGGRQLAAPHAALVRLRRQQAEQRG